MVQPNAGPTAFPTTRPTTKPTASPTALPAACPTPQPTTSPKSIADSTGKVTWTGPATGLGAGAQTYTWNGQNQTGQKQADGGLYTITFTATDASGAPITPTTSSSGVATAVQEVNGQTMVTVGKVQVPLTSITGVNG